MAYTRQQGQWVVQGFTSNTGWQQLTDVEWDEWTDAVQHMKDIKSDGCVTELRVYRTDDKGGVPAALQEKK